MKYRIWNGYAEEWWKNEHGRPLEFETEDAARGYRALKADPDENDDHEGIIKEHDPDAELLKELGIPINPAAAWPGPSNSVSAITASGGTGASNSVNTSIASGGTGASNFGSAITTSIGTGAALTLDTLLRAQRILSEAQSSRPGIVISGYRTASDIRINADARRIAGIDSGMEVGSVDRFSFFESPPFSAALASRPTPQPPAWHDHQDVLRRLQIYSNWQGFFPEVVFSHEFHADSIAHNAIYLSIGYESDRANETPVCGEDHLTDMDALVKAACLISLVDNQLPEYTELPGCFSYEFVEPMGRAFLRDRLSTPLAFYTAARRFIRHWTGIEIIPTTPTGGSPAQPTE